MEPAVKFIALGGWTVAFNTGITAELRKLGIRPEWKELELCELPKSLFDRIMKLGAPFSTDPGDLKNGQDHSHRNRLYFEKLEAEDAQARARSREQLIQEEVNRLLAVERAEKLAKLRVQAKRNLGIKE